MLTSRGMTSSIPSRPHALARLLLLCLPLVVDGCSSGAKGNAPAPSATIADSASEARVRAAHERWRATCAAAARSLARPDTLSDSAAAALIAQLDCRGTPVPVLAALWREWSGGPGGRRSLVGASLWATDPLRSADTTLFGIGLEVAADSARPRYMRLAALEFLAPFVDPHSFPRLPPQANALVVGSLSHPIIGAPCVSARADTVMALLSALTRTGADSVIQRSAAFLGENLRRSRRC